MFKFLKYRFSKKAKRRAEIQLVAALLLGFLLACALVIWQMKKNENRTHDLMHKAEQAQAEQLPPGTRKIGGPFTLTNQDGKTVADTNFHGKYLLVYFGYTYCPDVCPTGLQSIAHVMDQLKADTNKVQPLYITIDPARDTPAKLKAYINSFHPKIVGLTGSPEQIAAVAKVYQVYYAKGEKVDENDYLMDHSSLIYLMGPDGKFIATFPDNADPATLLKALREHWSKASPAPQ
ncbi:MAG: SCO family protein [Alphaproteobacteria bacterium]|nr:SCO family protein [Alphaproteobacteria bacterium]